MIFTAKVEAGANVVVFGLGGISLNVIQGAKMVGADKIIGVDLNPAREAMARKFGMTHFINPKDVENVVDHIIQLTTRAGASRSSSAWPRPARKSRRARSSW
ncbi:L-threonine 3-dehydrogenase [compost metagenome]